MNETNVVTIEWDGVWSYRPSGEVNRTNDSVWFALVFFIGTLAIWVTVCVRSLSVDLREKKIVAELLRNRCSTDTREIDTQKKQTWILRPAIILTRSTASLTMAVASVELLTFNAIANFVGDGSFDASVSLFVLLQAVVFYFYTAQQKYRKSAFEDSTFPGKHFVVNNSLTFLLIGGILTCILGHVDAFSLKGDDRKSVLFFIGVVLCDATLFGKLVVASLESLFDAGENQGGSKLSLVLSGEYYASFSVLDYLIVWVSLTLFTSTEAYFISYVQTDQYAMPFIFLQIVPIYGFIVNTIPLATLGDREQNKKLPLIFNVVGFSLLSLCVTTAMLHACAIPGVTTLCATHIAHTSLNTNVVVCGPAVILMSMISLGPVFSTFAPPFLVKKTCDGYLKHSE